MSGAHFVRRFSSSSSPSFLEAQALDRLSNGAAQQNANEDREKELANELNDEVDKEGLDAEGMHVEEVGEEVPDQEEVTKEAIDEKGLDGNGLDEEELDEEELDEEELDEEELGEEVSDREKLGVGKDLYGDDLDKEDLDREDLNVDVLDVDDLDGDDLDADDLDADGLDGNGLDGNGLDGNDLDGDDLDGDDPDVDDLYEDDFEGELEKGLDRTREGIAGADNLKGIGEVNGRHENAMGEIRRRSRLRRLKDMGFTPPTFNPFSYLRKGGLLFHGKRESKDPKLTGDRSSPEEYTTKASLTTREGQQLPTRFSRNTYADSDKEAQKDTNALEGEERTKQYENNLNKERLVERTRPTIPQINRGDDKATDELDGAVNGRNSEEDILANELEGSEWKKFMEELNKDTWEAKGTKSGFSTTPTCSAGNSVENETRIKTCKVLEESTHESQGRPSTRASKKGKDPEERKEPTFWGMNSYEPSYSTARSQADTPQLRRTMSDESDYRSSSSGGVRAVDNQTARKQVTLKGILRSKSEGGNDADQKTSKSSGPRVRFAELDSVVEYWTDDEDIWKDDGGEDVMGIPDAMHNVMKLAGRCVKRPKSFWKGVKHLIKFLQDVDCVGANLYNGEGLRAAVFRYERIWLPMYCAYLKEAGKLRGRLSDKAERKIGRLVRAAKDLARLREDEPLFRDMVPVPPIDVSWVWFLHRCSPKAYKADCERLFGVVLHMQRKNAFKYEASGSSARNPAMRKRWKEFVAAFSLTRSRYCEYISRQKYLPRHLWSFKVYDNDEDRLVDPSTMPGKWKTRINYNLFVAARRHRGLLCSFVGEDFDKNCCSRNPVTFYRYITYLHLAGSHRTFLPMPDIEPLLYSHMAASRNFADDSLKIGGRLVDPDVLTVRRSIDSDACTARLRDSERIWEEFLEDDLEYNLPNAFDICKAPSRTRAGYLEHCLAEQHERVYTRRTRRSSITHK